MVLMVRALATLPEDLSSIPSSCTGIHNSQKFQVQGIQRPALAAEGTVLM